MSFFKRGDTPVKTIVENTECKRHFKYLESSKPYVNLGGYKCTEERGFKITHELDSNIVHLHEVSTGMYSFGGSGHLMFSKRETVEALVETLLACLEEWE